MDITRALGGVRTDPLPKDFVVAVLLMSSKMAVEVELGAEFLFANLALKPLNAVVIVDVFCKVPALGEGAVATFQRADKWSFPSVDSQMIEKVTSLFEHLTASFIPTN